MTGSVEGEITRRSRTASRAQLGITAPEVIVETHLGGGLPSFTLVGLPETAVREARDRVRGALANCGFDFPNGRVVVNLAPADLLKEGGRFDLAIAVSVLRATGQLKEPERTQAVLLGELSLAGELRGARGCLCAALSLKPDEQLLVPSVNAAEVAPAGDRAVPLAHLRDVCSWLTRPEQRKLLAVRPVKAAPTTKAFQEPVVGQEAAKRALAIAAAGGHHLLMIGPPGTGKSLLARSMTELLPPLEERAAMEVAAIYSAAGIERAGQSVPPFRDPHHSTSVAALVGGGPQPRPGEISLAHHGVLFLDELPHFKPSVLDSLREPLETGRINLVRAAWRTSFPSRFQLLAAMNPCPAGLACSPGSCRCRPDQAQRYRSRVSGPLLDRVDLHVGVPAVPSDVLLSDRLAPAGSEGRSAVAAARQRQLARQGCCNAELPGNRLGKLCALNGRTRALLARAAERYGLSARGTHRVLKVSRTVADLDESAAVTTAHLTEALGYRNMNWGQGGA
jgi:magnesium chelatase family protein